MKNNPAFLTILSLSLLIMVSCNLTRFLSPAPAAAVSPTATSTIQAPPTQEATITPTFPAVVNTEVSNLPLSTPITAVTALPCNKATFVSDVKTPDGTVFHPGDPVVKTWRLKNEGSCAWTTDYKLVFNRGYNFLGVKSINLAKTVAPGESANLSLTFSAPDTLGTFVSFWDLQDPSGTTFGTGETGTVPLGIRIVVQAKH